MLAGHSGGLSGAVFSPDGSRILTFGRDKTARVWDAADGRELLALTELTDWVRAACFSPNGHQILTGCLSPSDAVRLWDSTTGKELLRVPGSVAGPQGMAFSPDGSHILTVNIPGGDANWYWEQQTGRKLERLPGSPGEDCNGHIWDTNGREILALKDTSDQSKQLAIYSPNGLKVFTDSAESGILWDAVSGDKLFYVTNFNDSYATHFTAACFSPNGLSLLTGNDANSVDLWDAADGSKRIGLEGDRDPRYPNSSGSVAGVTFSPDGLHFLAWGSAPTVPVWDANGTKTCTLEGHTDAVFAAIFSPNGERVLTASRDGTARLWDSGGG
jgi:WD40 repeat protein